jgi:stalled ribosome rescue protein Dom34
MESMTKRIGIWIDHKRAVILTVSEDGEHMQEIESGIEHPRLRGVSRSRAPYSAQYQKGDDQLDKQYDGYLKKYYDSMIGYLHDADAVLILGPGEAKVELKKRLEREKTCPPISGIFPADKMTGRQFAAKVRKHFQEAGEGV